MLQGFGALVRNIARKTARYEEGEKELQLQRSKLRTKKNQNKSTNEIGICPICRHASQPKPNRIWKFLFHWKFKEIKRDRPLCQGSFLRVDKYFGIGQNWSLDHQRVDFKDGAKVKDWLISKLILIREIPGCQWQ